MPAYLIVYGRDPTDRLAAYAFASREEARAASRRLVPSVPVDGYGRYDESREARPGSGGCACVVENEEDVSFSGSRLVDVYNGLTGETVSRFESRAVGIRRLLARLPAIVAGEATEEKDLSDNATAHAEPSDASGTAPPLGRRPRVRDDAIFKLRGDIPWKDGKKNHSRLTAAFAAVPEPRRVKALVEAGLTRGDIAYLIDHGHAEAVNPD